MNRNSFVMILGNTILKHEIKKYADEFDKDKSVKGSLFGVRVYVEEYKRYSMTTVKNGKKLVCYIKKPGEVVNSSLYDVKKAYAMLGIYFFDPFVFRCYHGIGRIQLSIR
jgi:dTDP-glucose pyrophosphorylase